jgi:CheY-like chemotaxis protein
MPKILLVDDDDAYRGVLSTILTKVGYEIVAVANYDEAIFSSAAEGVDLVITDIVMPGRDGVEIIETLKRRQPELKIIAMSGSGRIVTTKYLKTATEHGADAIIDKPFSTEQLIRLLEKFLPAPIDPGPVQS